MSQVRSSKTKKSPAPASAQLVPVTSVHKVEADGVRVFYREAGTRIPRLCYCSMGSRLRLLCFGNSFRALPTITE